jgi:hypothetical protein
MGRGYFPRRFDFMGAGVASRPRPPAPPSSLAPASDARDERQGLSRSPEARPGSFNIALGPDATYRGWQGEEGRPSVPATVRRCWEAEQKTIRSRRAEAQLGERHFGGPRTEPMGPGALSGLDSCCAGIATCHCCSLRIRQARVSPGRMAKATAEAKVSINERPPPRAYPSANVL